ncbi:hypothetical protein PORY_001893 [Pneumocystis oryctolagi]|uniref:Uncharacterized protein n=1 Tax=Pneumocystis oryctolagi TaxID=42067 RepID=A0ACB7CCR7_9ASCO|nr:hypothetical protein PORY_001893 [Pneumocystis oryctolagi]
MIKMKKKGTPRTKDSHMGSFGEALRLGSTLPPAKFHQHVEKFSSETASSFALGDMVLLLDKEEDVGNTLEKSFERCSYNNTCRKNDFQEMDDIDKNVYTINKELSENSDSSQKRNQEFSIPKNLERQKYPRLQYYPNKVTSLAFSHKENPELCQTISNGSSLPGHCSPPSSASCCVSEEIVVCKDFSFSKKNLKKHLLSSSITKFHNSVEENNLLCVSEKKKNICMQETSNDKILDNELSDLDFYDNDEGIFPFDKNHSSPLMSFKELHEKNGKKSFNKDEEKIENEKECTIVIKEKNLQMFDHSQKIELSPYSDNEDLFWAEDFQDENPYIPLFKKQTYERYSSSDDIWSYYTSSLGSETNDTNTEKDINRIPNECFFDDFNTPNQRGDTTDEDQSFIIKNSHIKKESNASNNDTKEESSCFTKIPDHTLTHHNSKASTLAKKEDSESNQASTVALSMNSGIVIPNTVNKPPLLGTWTRDLKRPMGIIDGTCTNVINPITSSSTILSPTSTNLSPSSIPSLDDILDTSAFVQLSSSNSSSSSITKNYLSDFYRWDKIPIGTFRRHQQRFANTREELIKGEWYVLTNKSRRLRSNVPILGTTVCHKKRPRKRKYRNKLKNNIELFENEEETDREQCGLGLGPQLSPLFNGLF